MVYSLPGRMGSGSIHTVVAGRQIDHNQALADLVRANQAVGTWVVVVGMAYAAVHRLPKCVDISEEKETRKRNHTFAVTYETFFHHAIEYCARSDKALIHRHEVS